VKKDYETAEEARTQLKVLKPLMNEGILRKLLKLLGDYWLLKKNSATQNKRS
jgi:hypothetical protein